MELEELKQGVEKMKQTLSSITIIDIINNREDIFKEIESLRMILADFFSIFKSSKMPISLSFDWGDQPIIKQRKHKSEILDLLNTDIMKMKSTTQVLKDLEKLTGKVINWGDLYRNLNEMEKEGLVERMENKAGIFWKKKTILTKEAISQKDDKTNQKEVSK